MLDDSNLPMQSHATRGPTNTRDAERLRSFYTEYCEAVKQSKESGELNVHDILVAMNFLALSGYSSNSVKHAVSTANIVAQSQNFTIDLRSQMETEDFVKNLFKLLCGIMNMTLKQRGHNQMP